MGLTTYILASAGIILSSTIVSYAMNQVKKNIGSQRKSNQDWYDRRYNEDATQRADAQRILNLTEQDIMNLSTRF